MSSNDLKVFAVELYKINAIKFGEFKTKVGLMTPVYCDLRVIVSYPRILSLADLLLKQINNLKDVDILCGVPYTALPIATAVSLTTGLPMVMRRKEAKDYGTKKIIEGVFQDGNECLIVEDVVTSGSSILETAKDLQNEGIVCKHAVVLLNREQGGERILENNGIKMHALLTLTQLIEYLTEAKCLNESIGPIVNQYLSENQVMPVPKNPSVNRLKMSFLERSRVAQNPIAEKLFKIMSTKQTTLCLAADFTDSTNILNLAEQIGPYICALKTHIDIVEDFHPNIIKPLQDIAERHNFVLFEDRKFADIGKTVELQYSKGLYQISSWADLVTAHSLTGKGALDAIKGAPGKQKRGVFILAETSASGSLITETYTKSSLKLASEYPDLIAGIVCQNPLFLDNPGLLQLTPGVKIEAKPDNLGQSYNSPEFVVTERGADIAVVGRGITQDSDPVAAAQRYRNLLWKAYTSRIF